jgi:peroxiredoxin
MPAKLKPGDLAPDFTLPATDGSTVRLAQRLPLNSATVVLFICNHCPYVKAYIPRLIELQRELAGRVQLLAICSNDAATYPADSFEGMKTTASQWGLNFPYLRDESQTVARSYGAERTPEVFVIDPKGVCRYEGGIDDSYQDASKVRDRPLHEALVAMLAHRDVPRPQTYAIGCTIKWKKGD